MRKTIALFIITALAAAVSCSKKMNPSKDTASAPVKPAVTYAVNVSPLIQTKCVPCHVPSKGGFKKALDTYDAVKATIDDIIYRVKLAPGTPKYMPFKHPPLSAEEVAVFVNWKNGGFKEN